MVKILQVKCGLHPEIEQIDDLPVGSEFVFSLGLKGKPHTIDLCPKCHEGTIKVLQEAIASGVAELIPEDGRLPHGKPKFKDQHSLDALIEGQRNGQRRGKPADRNVPCLWCPLSYSGGGHSKTLPVKHLKVHGFADSAEAFGRFCPLCNDAKDQLGGHIARAHPEVENVPAAFLLALELGDPYKRHEEAISRGENVRPRDS